MQPDWKTKTCGQCDNSFDVKMSGPIIQAQPQKNVECREAPPQLIGAPTMGPNGQPILQILPKYGQYDANFPACSRYRERPTQNSSTLPEPEKEKPVGFSAKNFVLKKDAGKTEQH